MPMAMHKLKMRTVFSAILYWGLALSLKLLEQRPHVRGLYIINAHPLKRFFLVRVSRIQQKNARKSFSGNDFRAFFDELEKFWRRGRDLNPRYRFKPVYSLSRRAPSAGSDTSPQGHAIMANRRFES